jgi:8-oxo-dGTP diphosphatase
VTAPDGRTFWGTFGAAGLLVHDERGILLQHRVEWSHFGGTWGLPGGARHEGESAVRGALRESEEEAGVPADDLVLEFTSVLDLGIWSYTTVAVRAAHPFDAVIGDAESVELRWIPLEDVDSLPLHPGFAARWPVLRPLIESPIAVIVDAANVVGSRPNGWWKDRAGAAATLIDSLAAVSDEGIPGSLLDLSVERCWPSITAVLEGEARHSRPAPQASAERAATDGIRAPQLAVDRATGEGADQIGDHARARRTERARVVVVTADVGLRERVEALGCATRGPRWLWGIIDGLPGTAT